MVDASSVVTEMSAGLRRCYNKGLAVNPNLQGSLRIAATVEASGKVVSTRPLDAEWLPRDVLACMVERVSSAVFAPFSQGSVTVTIPVTLTP
jgi:hypothetical protein